MMHCVQAVSSMRAKATKAYCYEEVQTYGKILLTQNNIENG